MTMRTVTNLKKIKYAAFALCLFAISFWIGYTATEYYSPRTITATVDTYNYSNGDLLLLDQNGELWVFTDMKPPKDSDKYTITYRKHWELLSLTCNGQEIPV